MSGLHFLYIYNYFLLLFSLFFVWFWLSSVVLVVPYRSGCPVLYTGEHAWQLKAVKSGCHGPLCPTQSIGLVVMVHSVQSIMSGCHGP